MTTLHDDQALVGDRVFDAVDGPGIIKAVGNGCLHVQFGKCGIKKYTTDGFTGKRCAPTLFWQPLPTDLMRVMSKNTCKARLQMDIIKTNVKLMHELICADCPDIEPEYECCEPEPTCIPEDPCKTEKIRILKEY